MKIIRLFLVCSVFASCSSDNGPEAKNGLIDQCLQDPVKEVTLGSGRGGWRQASISLRNVFMMNLCMGVWGFPKRKGT